MTMSLAAVFHPLDLRVRAVVLLAHNDVVLPVHHVTLGLLSTHYVLVSISYVVADDGIDHLMARHLLLLID